MPRILGIELAPLLVMGFAIGILSFLFWSTKREVLLLQGDNERLSKRMLESVSKSDTFKYKKSLAESDLDSLRREMAAKDDKVSSLSHQVTALQQQVNEAKIKSEEEKKKFSQYSSEKEEMQGIQDRLLSDVEGCRKSLKKCEDAKGSSAKAASANCVKKTKHLEETNKSLTTKLEAADERIVQLIKQAEKCGQPVAN